MVWAKAWVAGSAAARTNAPMLRENHFFDFTASLRAGKGLTGDRRCAADAVH
ncbi:hypothetical protein D3C78_1565170 [compost metagenome]